MKLSGNIFRYANERCGALVKTVKTGALRQKNAHTGNNRMCVRKLCVVSGIGVKKNCP